MPPSDYYIPNKCILMLMGLGGLRVVEGHNLNISDIIRDQEDTGIEVSGKGSSIHTSSCSFISIAIGL